MGCLLLGSTGPPLERRAGMMGTTSVRQLLRSLCLDSQWEYAVFWRLKHRSRMFLTWEDGYCDYPKARSFVESKSENVCFSETARVASSHCEISTYGGSCDGYPMGLAVASMSCLLYSLGEGTVGRVASTGKHCWVSSDEFYSNLLPEVSDPKLKSRLLVLQTILLVPVVPLGVVQLGSLEKVNKDTKVVAHIKDMFNTLQLVPDASIPLTLSRDLPGQSTSRTSLLEKSKPSAITSNLQNPIQSRQMVKRDLNTLDYVQILKNRLSIINPDIKSQLVGQDNVCIQEKNTGRLSSTQVGALLPSPTGVSFPQCEFSNASHFEKFSNMPNFSFHDEASASAQSVLSNLGFDFDADMNMNLCSSNDMMDLPFGDEIYMENDHESVCDLFTFPAESELHKALGPAFENKFTEYVREENIAGEPVCSSSSLIGHSNPTWFFEPPVMESSRCFSERSAKEDLLDAVVASAFTASGDTAFNISNNVKSPTTSSRQFTASCQTVNQSLFDVLVGDDLGQWGNRGPEFVSQNEVDRSSPSEASLKSVITTQVDEMQQKKGCGDIQSRRGTKLSSIGKRKSRLGDVQKPRPRDRQMIQDRVRELRELVPNGAKCSIDSLLDRTVKHMLFLRSVTNQAEKLKQRVNRKVGGRKNWKSSEAEGHHNGTSWKFELGRQLRVCPVIVEDLDHPGHMLIEVLCEEHRLFLEIAQVLRNLELTVLKGVTEKHSDKILAHFIVEVSSGFNRMDIFWPLMHLLQRNNPIPSIF
ncbi:Myc-type [Macleaya cordata]|uniref:Myc-type n=1 Tax=Macleaya cordata TaxID=56857 RepID=A0A200R4Z9_MACCD|nr:Myc-type [Macleaya cordata]